MIFRLSHDDRVRNIQKTVNFSVIFGRVSGLILIKFEKIRGGSAMTAYLHQISSPHTLIAT